MLVEKRKKNATNYVPAVLLLLVTKKIFNFSSFQIKNHLLKIQIDFDHKTFYFCNLFNE